MRVYFGDVVYQFMKHTARKRRLLSACECFFVHWCDKMSWLGNILLKLCVRTSRRYHITRENMYMYIIYIYMCVWCVCMHMYIRTKIHNGGNYAHAQGGT